MDDDDLDDMQPRSAAEIAERVLALIAVIGKVQFPSHNAKWIEDHGIARYLSEAEQEFVDNPSPAQRDKVNFSWRAEALVPLLWSLHGLEQMPGLDKQFDAFGNAMVRQAIQQTPQFLQQARRREPAELEAQEQYLYHQHWRVRDRDHGFNNDEPGEDDPDIKSLNSGLVYERRYAMSWIVGHGDSWDDVPTDT